MSKLWFLGAPHPFLARKMSLKPNLSIFVEKEPPLTCVGINFLDSCLWGLPSLECLDVFGHVLAAVWTFQVSICCILYRFLLSTFSMILQLPYHTLEICCIIHGFCSLYIMLMGHPPIRFAYFWTVYQGKWPTHPKLCRTNCISTKMTFLLANGGQPNMNCSISLLQSCSKCFGVPRWPFLSKPPAQIGPRSGDSEILRPRDSARICWREHVMWV